MRQAHSRNQLSLFQKAYELPRRKVRAVAFAGESHAVQFLSIMLALCVAAYLYFVGVSIMNVISNREASAEIERVRSSVASLEKDYFTLSKAISPKSADSFGLTTNTEATYVRRAVGVAAMRALSDM